MQNERYDSLNLAGKTILITGAAGFIGSNLVRYFTTHHPHTKILALDYFRDGTTFINGNPSSLGHFKNLAPHKNVEVLAFDISNFNDLRKTFAHYGKIHYVFHQAAISDTTCTDMKHVMDVNLNAFKELVKIAARHEAHIIYASSAATYGITEAPNSVGKNELPENIYGYSKLCMDIENARMQEELQSMEYVRSAVIVPSVL